VSDSVLRKDFFQEAVCGNTSDLIDHSLPKHFVSAHEASHHAWAPGPPPSKSGADTG